MKTLSEIIEIIKEFKSVLNDGDVAGILKIKPKTLATAKLRNSIPYEALTTFCNKEGLSLNWILTGEGEMMRGKETAIYNKEGDFVYVPMVLGKISAGGGLIPETAIELKIAFKRDWIQRHGNPNNMSLIRVEGDSMEPTLSSGDIVLVDHNKNYISPQGGIYAIAIDEVIMIKRVQVIYPSKKIRIISDNPKYEHLEVSFDQVIINGKVIWFGREIER